MSRQEGNAKAGQAPKEPAPAGRRGLEDPTTLIVVVALLFLGFLLPRFLRRRRPGAPAEAPGTFEPAARNAREELDRLLTDLQDISREHIARLDTKIRLLNQLLLECDQKQRALESLLARAPLEPATPPAPPPPQPRPANPLHDQVYTLQDSGRELQDICAATGLEKGEVELILGLRRMPPAGR